MDIQRIIGADIIMAFDECTPYPCEYQYAKKSIEMTHRWLKRCCERFDSTETKYGYSQSPVPYGAGIGVQKSACTISRGYCFRYERECNAIGGLSGWRACQERNVMP